MVRSQAHTSIVHSTDTSEAWCAWVSPTEILKHLLSILSTTMTSLCSWILQQLQMVIFYLFIWIKIHPLRVYDTVRAKWVWGCVVGIKDHSLSIFQTASILLLHQSKKKKKRKKGGREVYHAVTNSPENVTVYRHLQFVCVIICQGPCRDARYNGHGGS